MEDEALPVPRAADLAEVLQRAAEAVARGVPGALATVLSRKGSAPATPGQKLLWTAEGLCVGTVGGGALERAVLKDLERARARAAEGDAEPRTVTFRLGPELGMCCGGGVEVLLEPLPAAFTVGLVGAGHVARALVPVLRGLGFVVCVSDAREAYSTELPGARVVPGDPAVLGPEVPRRGALLVMTHDHQLDQVAVEWALREGYAFVGCVGSRAKAARTRARLEARGFSPEDCARVQCPLGVPVLARTPAEIAVAIGAELVRWRRETTLARSPG
ncbi:MAG: XdhC family protein [Deltaproteobacteria bacterium]|nr:XdhC family protein [Deltaproteobacteria bacterium]